MKINKALGRTNTSPRIYILPSQLSGSQTFVYVPWVLASAATTLQGLNRSLFISHRIVHASRNNYLLLRDTPLWHPCSAMEELSWAEKWRNSKGVWDHERVPKLIEWQIPKNFLIWNVPFLCLSTCVDVVELQTAFLAALASGSVQDWHILWEILCSTWYNPSAWNPCTTFQVISVFSILAFATQ